MGYISNKRICRYINRHSFVLISLLRAPDILCKKKKLYDTILTLIPIATVLIPFIHFRPHTCMNVHISNNLQKGCYTKYFSIHQNKWYIETLPLRIFCKILFFNAIDPKLWFTTFYIFMVTKHFQARSNWAVMGNWVFCDAIQK